MGSYAEGFDCENCGKIYKVSRFEKGKSTRFCSRQCLKEFQASNKAKTVLTNNPGIRKCDVGSHNELIVCADLMKKGYHVFRAVSAYGPCDLIAMKDGKLWRVEVTTGYYRKNGSMGWTWHDRTLSDVIAAVMPDSTVIYVSESF
jgi:hypothetical protein